MKRFSQWSFRWSLAALMLVLVLALPWAAMAEEGETLKLDVVRVGSASITVASGASFSATFRVENNSTGVDADRTFDGTASVATTGGIACTPTSADFSALAKGSPLTISLSCTAPTGPATGTIIVSASGTPSPKTGGGVCGVGGNKCSDDGVPNKLTVNVSAPSDTTPPVITPNVGGTLGDNGWYVSDVSVSWTVTDPESAITSKIGCDPTTINTDTSGTTLTCTATSAGGTSSQSVTIKRDATPPTISGTASPAPNAAGWNNMDVTVSFTCGDSMSGVASCGPDQTLSSEGSGQSAMGTAIDNAGNSASATVSGINIDKTPPTASASVSPGPNANGWNNTAVVVSFSGSDALSGIDSCSAPVTLSSEGAGQSASGTCTDKAGNVSAPATASGINIDKTVPTASANVSPGPNANGWNNTDVTVSFSGSDDLSGIEGCSAPVTLSSEGAGQSASGTCTDLAGNVSAPATASGINIDKTPPTFGACPAGGPFLLNSGLQSVGPIAVDATISGLNAGASTLSGLVDTSSIGNKTVTFTAVDNAGNSATKSCSYSVIYNWNGFFRPVDKIPTLNAAKAGSAIPVKFSLSGNQGLNIFAAGYPKSAVISCDSTAPVDAVEETVTAGGSSLSYDASVDQYVYVWKTDKAWTGCRQLVVKLNDSMEYRANFKFSK